MKKRSLVLIDRSAILHNVSVIKKQAFTAQVFAVVKQDAYGHGAVETARLLSPVVDRFVVATLDEGIELRRAGIVLPILVLEPPRADFNAALRSFNLTASVSELEHVRFLENDIAFHVEINTGMNRLGIEAGNVAGLAALLKEMNRTPEAIFTHFASSMDRNEALTRDQYSRFRAVFHHFDASVIKHAGNSEAAFQLNESHFDAVRPGVALFGESVEPALRPVMSWLSYVAQTRKLAAGDGLSYGWTWQAAGPTFVATVPVGYADGYPRISSNKTLIDVDGKWFPQAGTVTMDYTFADIGTFHAPVNTPVWLLNPSYTVRDLAAACGTISYELMCSIGSRNQRLHIDSFDHQFKIDIQNKTGVESETVLSRK